MFPSNVSLKSWYETLAAERAPYLDRAEKASKYTIPWYVKNEGEKDASLEANYQSVGSQGVNNLASRLIMVLMPPNRPMFRLRVPRKIVEESHNAQKAQLLNKINSGLSRIETEASGLIEGTSDRTQLYSAMLHLIIAGNVLLSVQHDGTKVFSLRNYVVQRDSDGNPLVIIVREQAAYQTLPKAVRKKIHQDRLLVSEEDEISQAPVEYELYTAIVRKDDKWTVRQECEGVTVGKPGTYPLDACPWLPLRLYRSEEEDYGRGYVEQYYGTLYSVHILSKAILEATGAAAKVVFLVHPSATTNVKALATADNLSFVQGNKNDIDVLQTEKAADMKTAQAYVQDLTAQLAKVFLMNTSIQRTAERVTAEEIRFMAQELETALGGLYSVLAKEFQRPYINLRIKYFQDDGVLDPFPEGVEVSVVTGIDALGRGQDANTLVQYGQQIFKMLPPDATVPYLNIQGYIKALAAAYGIDDTIILKPDEQMQAEQQQTQQQEMLKQAIPGVVNAGGKIIAEQMKGENTNV